MEQAALTALLQFPGAYVTVASQMIGLGGLFALAYRGGRGRVRVGLGHPQDGRRARREPLALHAADAPRPRSWRPAWRWSRLTPSASWPRSGGASLAGVPLTGLGDSAALLNIPPTLLHVWLAIAEEMAVGFAVATLTRSQLAGVGAGIALFFGEQFATLILPDVVKFLPFNAASAVVARANLAGAGAPAALPPDQATLVTIAWLVAALLLVAGATERAEIGS